MQVTVGNQLRIKNPSEQLLTWCKKQLILSNPEYIKKKRMGFWTGNTPEKLYLFQWDGDTLVLPYGCLNDVLAMDDCHMKVNLPTPTEVDFGCTIDNDKGYSPDNCRWVTPRQNCCNRSTTHFVTAFGKRQSLMEWSRELNISYNTLKKRVTDHHEDGEYLLRPSRRKAVI